MSRTKILALVKGKTLEGWDLDYFLSKALVKRKYANRAVVLADLSVWLETQG